MINKFPNKAMKKWTRYTNIEKWFIVYCILLTISILAFPILHIWNTETFYLFNIYSVTTSLLVIISLLFLIIWSISFRFKKVIYILFWFKENEALINFWILMLITISYISIWDTVNILKNIYDYNINIWSWYYISWLLLIIWLIWNIILAVDLSQTKKKNRIINIIQKWPNDNENDTIKSLFDNK